MAVVVASAAAPRPRCQRPAAGKNSNVELAVADAMADGTIAEHRGAQYRRRLPLRLAMCVAIGLVLPCLAPSPSMVPPPQQTAAVRLAATHLLSKTSGRKAGSWKRLRQQGDHVARGAGEDMSSSEQEDLKRKIAELQAKLTEGGAQPEEPEPIPEDAPLPPAFAAGYYDKDFRNEEVNKLLEDAWEEVQAALPELATVDDRRMGFMVDKQYVFSRGNTSAQNPIYKRKQEVLANQIEQQGSYMKEFNKAVKKARELKAVKTIADLYENGAEGYDRRIVRQDIETLKTRSRVGGIFFRDILPEIMQDPFKDAVGLLITVLVLLAVFGTLCFCLYPPVNPDAD
mmetsp:Transcript_47430/g.91678  ORF Transcript_47430/g.91678 Transcript_47430/m.91678 type:complete len:342 (+) Transcript_47430:81-1106(+)